MILPSIILSSKMTAKFVRPLRAISFAPMLVVLALFSLSPLANAQTTPPETDVAGSWTGALGAGAQQLHLVLTVTRVGSGQYSGEVNSVDQGSTFPISGVTLNGNTFHFEVKSIGGVYEGTLNDSKTELKGTWTQAHVPAQPLDFERSKPGQEAKAAPPTGPKTKPFTVAIDVTVPIAPTAFKADGKWHMVYELHVVNMAPWEVTLTKIEALTGDSAGKSLDSYSGADLEGMIQRPGLSPAEKSKIAAGTEAVVDMWLTVDSEKEVPARILHRVTAKLGDYPEEVTTETNTNPLPVRTGAVVITPPLTGDHWWAANGPSNTSGHRRALIPIDAHAVISQRFAIDWVKVGDDGKTYKGDPLDNKNYYAFGVDALAVADGVVTEVKDGIPLNTPGENSRAVEITLETVGGNHVIIDIGNGNYAFYAHLQPGSLRVKLGDKVRRGQVVGLVGNTGNSTEPHLHFHISNGSSPLGSEGLPYQLKSFQVEGHGPEWKPSDTKGAPETHTLEIPLENEIVKFPAPQK
jgi:murein DD-endopeptidase